LPQVRSSSFLAIPCAPASEAETVGIVATKRAAAVENRIGLITRAVLEENKAIVRRGIEELHNHTGNLDATDEIQASDLVGHDPAMPEDLHGVEVARQFAATFRSAFPDLTCAIKTRKPEGTRRPPALELLALTEVRRRS
jgi:SnoaL-like polyketide cyclase